MERLLAERLSVKDVVRLTRLDQPTVRRLLPNGAEARDSILGRNP
jgi:hypothetical protein